MCFVAHVFCFQNNNPFALPKAKRILCRAMKNNSFCSAQGKREMSGLFVSSISLLINKNVILSTTVLFFHFSGK